MAMHYAWILLLISAQLVQQCDTSHCTWLLAGGRDPASDLWEARNLGKTIFPLKRQVLQNTLYRQ